jgi:tRNA G18 (ribose-2'-O)-methylase SpoU
MHRFNEGGMNNTETCLRTLKNKGYQIVVTALHEKTIALHEVDLSKKTAVLVG